jgi:type IV pilus assembly protein PilO
VELPKVNLDFLRAVPLQQKLALLGIIVAGIGLGFYYYVAVPKSEEITRLDGAIAKLDAEIQTTGLKVKHLTELVAANKQLEEALKKKKERLPPEEEAASLLKQLTDLGVKLGLDIKLWKPGSSSLDPSKLFVRMPVSVEVAGGYHTAALFFDRVNKLQRIINVSNLVMGSPRIEEDRVVIQTVFDLTAFASPPASVTPTPATGK